MICRLRKQSAVGLYCWCRQAERSIDLTLTGDLAQWARLKEYYDEHKREGIGSALKELKALGVHLLKPPAHEEVAYLSFWSPFLYLFRRMLNPFKSAWSFSKDELTFIYSILDAVLRTLDSSERPDQDSLIQLRMRLYDCQWIIGNRMCGLPEFDKATYIEHFCQSRHLTPVTLEEMGVLPPAAMKSVTGRSRA
jgi:hypothetical protein